jgi:hypothetical protein
MIGKNGHKLLQISANSFLFLSSLLLLINIAPQELIPGHRARVKALVTLKDKRTIFGTLPSDVKVEMGGRSSVQDEDAFRVLTEIIKRESTLAKNVEWDHVVGVGYSAVSVPVAGNTLEAIRPLYLILVPKDEGTVFRLTPVGQLEDLTNWLSKSRQSSLTSTALVSLALGFLLQLCGTLVSARETGSNRHGSLTS